MATFSANEINSTRGDVTGRTAHVQIKTKLCFFERIKNGGYEDIFPLLLAPRFVTSWKMFGVG